MNCDECGKHLPGIAVRVDSPIALALWEHFYPETSRAGLYFCDLTCAIESGRRHGAMMERQKDGQTPQ